MKKAKYILFEGSEGTGKTTQATKIVEALRNKGLAVLDTKEPGTSHSPITLELRKIMLDGKYEENFQGDAKVAREMISQSIRTLHLQNVVFPNLEKNDYIIQDRGIVSGLAYGVACENEYSLIEYLSTQAIGAKRRSEGKSIYNLYDQIIYFKGNLKKGLDRALAAKQEFASGDAMENKGLSFLEQVNQNFEDYLKNFAHETNVVTIEVEGKTIEEITQEILSKIL